MKRLKLIIPTVLLIVFLCNSYCSESHIVKEPEVYVSIAADANFVRFSNQDSIKWYLDRCRDAGFNHVVLDVKPNYGKVLYRSDYLPYLDYIEGVTPEPLGRDWDYLQFFIDECHKRDMRLSASFSIMSCGSPYWQRGMCYSDTIYDDMLCVEYRPDGSFNDMRDTRKAAAFLNPARPDVQDYELELIMELVNKYDIDGFSLDYCRYPDAQSDFSEFSRKAFETYLARQGKTLEQWPGDVVVYDEEGNRIDGSLAREWWAWRAGVISDFIKRAADSIHASKPAIDVEYWAATWIHALNASGQNWASPRSSWPMAYWYGTPEYQATGFAPYIDVFAAGAYLERVHGADDNESIEYAFNRADTLLKGDCRLVGSLYAINHDNNHDNPNNMYNAAMMSLEKTGNLRVFDISQIHKNDLWESIKRALVDYRQQLQ
ncbi:MAG: family 10 glycosylhydrolase [Ruminococcus flavefaciens]|nr:family 10 glycosylhydrolase [Ruminococcus flavefaciens]